MDFYEVVGQVLELLQHQGRVSYRALKRQFGLDDDYIEDLKEEIIYAQQLAVDEDNRVLIWTGQTKGTPAPASRAAQTAELPTTPQVQPPQAELIPPEPRTPEAERRQLTVMFCDLVDSTRLSGQLDPEDLRDVIRAYQATSAAVIERFDGYIAQYLGDGLLVYFGYPKAHEDDAQRAVRAGLGLLEAVGLLNIRLESDPSMRLAVRIGIHTGPVVVGEIGSGDRRERLALGDTPNLAARLQGLAAPDTVVMSAATARLVHGYFTCQALGSQTLKGMDAPVRVSQVLGESLAQSRLDVAAASGLTPLVGRETEVTLLRERWVHARDGRGQVVLLSGEAGIGKSRLVQVLTEQVATESQAWLMPYQCSSYHQHSALYPLIELLEQVALRFEREESPQQKLHKLEGFLVQYGLPLAEAVPLFAALLSLPLAAEYSPLHVPPAQQKQRTLQTLLTILLRIAAQQPVLFVMEDLHWVDPSTLEFLSLLVDQGPTVRILVLLTFRPDFRPPWTGRAHLTQVTVNRLPRHQAVEVIRQVAHGKDLPPEVMEQIVAKTDGVPLFVEELTKMMLESGLLQEGEDRYALTGPLPPLAIPTTLHDSLMARLDRLATVKGLAQLGATLGREFSYALLHAVSPWDEATVRLGLHQLVSAEFLYQQGQPPQATYRFKHALIQDAAYQSLLKSTRQRYHQHIAQVMEAHFPEVCETQPELLAHHYAEAGLREQAIPYWQHAGQRALQRSANLEAVSHVTRGLEVLAALPETRERAQQELALRLTLGPALLSTRGSAAPEVERVYVRASELGRQVGDIPQLFTALWGLSYSHMSRAQIQTACAVGEELLSVARQQQDPMLLLEAHRTLVAPLTILGEFGLALTHAQHGLALYDPQQMRAHALRYGQDSGVTCRLFGAWCLWLLGYPDQARQWSEAALTDAQRLLHTFTLAQALLFSVIVHHLRRETAVVQERAEVLRALCTEHNFAYYLAWGTVLQGSAWAAQGAWAEGLTQIREGLAAWRTVGGRALWHWFRALLAEAYGRAGQVEEGQRALSEALETLQTTEDRLYEAEVYRLKGELLQQAAAQQAEAEEHLQQALAVARRQQAKSLELRAAASLARLWQSQGKRDEARELLAPVYNWFTEGFDTADLIDAKALLDELLEGQS